MKKEKIRQKKSPPEINPEGFFCIKIGASCYSPTVKTAVPSPQRGLTTEFGMESGVSLSP